MVCKYYKQAVCPGDKTCTNASLTHVKFCPFVGAQKNKAPQCCTGFVKKSAAIGPHREWVPSILNSVMAGISAVVDERHAYNEPIIVTVECGTRFKARVPIIRNDKGDGWMTNKVYCRLFGNKYSKELLQSIKKYENGRRK